MGERKKGSTCLGRVEGMTRLRLDDRRKDSKPERALGRNAQEPCKSSPSAGCAATQGRDHRQSEHSEVIDDVRPG